MGTTATTTPPVSSAKHGTTLRGMATSSFCLACWGSLTFWWYPFGLSVATVALVLGLITLALGVRAGRNGENLALGGVILASNAIFMALVVYRGVQFFFEGTYSALP